MQVDGLRDEERLTYKASVSKQELMNYIMAVAKPSAILLLSFFVIIQFANYGKTLLTPMICIMWVTGTLCSMVLPSHRTTIINETLSTIGIYLVTLYGLKIMAGVLSGVSSGMMAASLSITMPETSGNTVLGYIQTFLNMGAVLTPLGFVGLQGQRLFKLKRNANKQRAIRQIRSIRDTNKNYQ